MARVAVRLSRPEVQRGVLAALMLLVLIAGILYSLHLGATLRFGDEFGYRNVAHNLATRGWYSEDGRGTTAYRAPGYPFLLCALMWLHVPVVGFRVFNFCALAGAMALAYGILRRSGFALAGLLAALMLATYPVLFYTAGTLYPQTLGVFFLLLTVWLAVRDPHTGRDYALAGLASGFLVLLIPSMLPMLPVFALMPWLLRRPRPGRLAATFLALSVLMVAPWTARNFVVFHRFVPVSTNGGINLLLGNSEHAGADTGYSADISAYERRAQGMGETQRDAFYRDQALRWAAHHKARALWLYALKVLNDFATYNHMDTRGVTSSTTSLLMLLSYGPLLALFVARWALLRAVPPTPLERFVALAYVADALLTAVFFTRIRFRLPFDALLICAVAVFLQSAWRVRRRSRIRAGARARKNFPVSFTEPLGRLSGAELDRSSDRV